jgi:hypothetical protein
MTRNGPAQSAQAGAEPQPRAVPLRTYDDVCRAVADHCEQIGMSRAELDFEAGLTDGHSSKLLSRIPRKRMTWNTLRKILAATGSALQLVKDPNAAPRDLDASNIESKRQRYDRTKHWRNVKGPAWGRRLNAKRNIKVTSARRIEIATKAARARWQRKKSKPAATSTSAIITPNSACFERSTTPGTQKPILHQRSSWNVPSVPHPHRTANYVGKSCRSIGTLEPPKTAILSCLFGGVRSSFFPIGRNAERRPI